MSIPRQKECQAYRYKLTFMDAMAFIAWVILAVSVIAGFISMLWITFCNEQDANTEYLKKHGYIQESLK